MFLYLFPLVQANRSNNINSVEIQRQKKRGRRRRPKFVYHRVSADYLQGGRRDGATMTRRLHQSKEEGGKKGLHVVAVTLPEAKMRRPAN